MKRLAISAGVAGLVVGQTFNGRGTEAFGLYLIGLAVVWGVLGAILALRQAVRP